MRANGLWITGNVCHKQPAGASKLAAPYASKTVSWFVGRPETFGCCCSPLFMSVVIATIVLYMHGESAAAERLQLLTRRLAGSQGEEVAILSAKAIRGVAARNCHHGARAIGARRIGLFFCRRAGGGAAHRPMLILLHHAGGTWPCARAAAILAFLDGEHVAGTIFPIWAVMAAP